MLNLTLEDKLQMKNQNFDYFNVQHFNFSCGSFYVKKCMGNESFMELFGKKIFDIAGIKCPNYYLFKDNFVLSEDLNELENFMYISDVPGVKEDVVWRYITFDIVSDSLCEIVNNKDEIKLQLAIMHFIDILFSNTDRHLNNYGVSIDKDGNGIVIVFDNGLFLDYFDCITKPITCFVKDFVFVKMKECDNFIGNLSDKYKAYIYELFCRFTPDFVSKLINKVEKENNCKLKNKGKILRKYFNNYVMVYGVLNKYINSKTKGEIIKQIVK